RYFAAMGIPIQAGRSLSDADRAGSPVVVVINETGARQLWPNESPIGKRILMEWGDTLRAEIVGVARDVRLNGPDRSVERATLYWDYRQTGVPSGMTLVVRGRSAEPAVEPIRAALAAIDPDLPLYNVRSMDGLRDAAVAQSRFITAALGLFSLLALGLAVLGVYGVMAYGVEQRTREIGVRLALGADRASVVRMLLRDGGRVVLPALAVGLGAAWVLTGFLRTLAFGVAPRDPVSLAGSLVVIGAAALAACWIPARRASAIPAVEAIRAD
ncbi:MAG: FtsX-like permease family protein, partial [Gemmatimonadetes bacterium]|nr:FtsX-like permease family protein [Gemmatimonadota bacterium]